MLLTRVVGARISQRCVGLRDLRATAGYCRRQFLRGETHDHRAGFDIIAGVEIDRDHAARYLRRDGRFAHRLDGGFGGISDISYLVTDRIGLQGLKLLRVAGDWQAHGQ